MDEKKKKKIIEDESLDQVTGGTTNVSTRDFSVEQKSIFSTGHCPFCNANLDVIFRTKRCSHCDIAFVS
jgi:hypothetical protein